MTPDEIQARQIEKDALTMRANVYVRVGGTYSTTPVKTGLKCHLSRPNLQAASSSAQRADLSSTGDLLWEVGYDLPNGAQLSVDVYPGWRFNVRDNTQWVNIGAGGHEVSRMCQVTRLMAPVPVP